VGRWGRTSRRLRNRRRYSSRKPNPQNLSPKCLNRLASKHVLRQPLGRSYNPNHNSTNLTNKSNRCLGPNKEAGPSLPKQS
jgi:hypothetical protein